jgi:hypothetical protein
MHNIINNSSQSGEWRASLKFDRKHIGKRYEKGGIGRGSDGSERYYKLSRVGRVDMVQHRSSWLEMEMVREKRREDCLGPSTQSRRGSRNIIL